MSATSIDPAISETLRNLASRWAAADKQILRSVFPLLARGKPVGVQTIVDATGATENRVVEALKYGRAGVNPDGEVVELSGLQLGATLHRVEIGNTALFTCCALMAHLTPFLLDRFVRIESVDPETRRVVRLEVTPSGFTALEPETATTSFVSTDRPSLTDDLEAAFCSHVRHFGDPESAAVFVAAHPQRRMVGVALLHEAAGELFREAWGDQSGV